MMKIAKLFILLGLTLTPALFVSAQTQKAKISAIHAQLFFENSGTFSDDLFARKELSLWNTIIGEGGAGGASSSTFVTVEITGKNLPVGKTKLELTAKGDKGKLLLKKLISVDIYDDQTKFFAPVWLYDTGCGHIKLSARLIGKNAVATTVSKTIPFDCGE